MRKYVDDFFENDEQESERRKSKRLKIVNIVLTAIIVLLVIAIILFTTTFTTIGVQGESMMPNVLNGDRLILLKWGYKLNYGDIVVFQRADEEDGSLTTIVKRVIAKGGDVISFDMSTMKWIRNGEAIQEDYFGGEYNNDYFTAILPQLTADGITVEDGYLFVLGDNRSISKGWSNDSHIYGTISQESVLGKVIKVINSSSAATEDDLG